VIKHKNINTKGTKQAYGTRLYFKLVLKRLKVMGVILLFIPFWVFNSRKLPELLAQTP
jgi:hypothetical protein